MGAKFEKLFLAVFCVTFLFLSSKVSLSLSANNLENEEKVDAFTPINCTQDSDCQDLCHKGNYLYSRCDTNGTCICDCSDPEVINSSYISPCNIRQPEGYWWDKCDSYCRQEYVRPCRYCTIDKSKFFCTCVCHYGGKADGSEEQ